MLISKSTRIEEGDLATFKLSNGDEIVGRVGSVSVIGDYEVTCRSEEHTSELQSH